MEIKQGLENVLNFSYWAFCSNTYKLLYLYTLGFISKYHFLLTSYIADMLFTPSCVDLPKLYSYTVES